ncbi:MAG: hypothetical protein V3R95_03240 [Dehalococcoidia bacterium]
MFRLHRLLARGPALGALGVVALVAVACGGDDGPASGVPSQAGPGGVTAAATTVAASTPAASEGFDGAASYEGGGAFDWLVTRVDRGTKPDIVVTSDGGVAVAYMLERTGAAGFVRVATLDGDAFSVETVQSGYLYGPLDLAAGPDGALAVGYHNHDWEDAAVAVLAADGWRVDRINDGGHDGWDTALAYAADGGLHLLGVDPSQFGSLDGVEYARLGEGGWAVEQVGSGPQPYEWGTAIAVASDGTLHALYFDAATRDLAYATNDGGGWRIERIYESGDAGRFPVLSLDGRDRPHVAFIQSDAALQAEGRSAGNVIYGAFDGSAWSFEQVASLDNLVLGFEGARRTVAIELAAGGPVIAYIDESVLGLATLSDGVWSVETLFAAGDEPFQVVGLALDANGAPHLAFSTITGNGPLDGEIWYVAPLAKG